MIVIKRGCKQCVTGEIGERLNISLFQWINDPRKINAERNWDMVIVYLYRVAVLINHYPVNIPLTATIAPVVLITGMQKM